MVTTLTTDPRLLEVVRDVQSRLAAAGVCVTLLHESPGPANEHDVDLAIDGGWPIALSAMTAAVASHGYRPVLLAEYDVANSWYVAFARLDGGTVSRMAIDTCGDARGIGKYGVPMRRLLTQRVVRSGLWHADPAWETTYMVAKHVWKRTPSSRALDETVDRARFYQAEFQDAARHVFGSKLTSRLVECIRQGPPVSLHDELDGLLRAIHVRRALRSPVLPYRFVRRWVARTLHPNGTWVVVSGPDGAGKSTAASQLERHLAPMFRRSLRLHWSPGVLPRPGSLVGRAARDPSQPHAEEPRGRILSTLFLLYHWLDHAIGYMVRIRPTLVRSGLVVIERGYHDVAVDPRRYRLDPPEGLVRVLGHLLPRPHLTILLLGDPSVLHLRKPELDSTEIQRQQQRWRELSPRLGTVGFVDAGSDPDAVVAAMLDAVIAARSTVIGDELGGRAR